MSNLPRSTSALLGAAILGLTLSATPAYRAPGGPCAFVPIDVNKYGHDSLQNPPELRSKGGKVSAKLTAHYTDPAKIKIGGCPVRLRTYDGQLVGPTIRVKPGDAIDLQFENQLPMESHAEVDSQFQQQASQAFIDTKPHSYNTTNVHYHGLHVSPNGNSDNVLIAIHPKEVFPYHVQLPKDHTPGTYWYHAHAHGSTAIQVGSGMEGTIIVEDDSTKIPRALKEANKHEKVMVFATILYDTAGRADNISAFFPDNSTTDSLCRVGNNGCTWENSHRRTTINGQIVPIIKMRPGEVQRWRMVDAGFRESLTLRLEGHSLHEIATDGIYLGRIDTWGPRQTVDLEPGYRSDVLVKASMTPGRYRLLDDTSSSSVGLRGVAERSAVLAEVVIEGQPMDMALPTSAEMARLAYLPGDTLAKKADGLQEAVFKLGASPDTLDQRNYFQVNYAAFNPTRVRQVKLGATEQWSITTVGDPFNNSNTVPSLPHVFHIHVNPFQVQRLDPAGKPEWVWKDTQIIPAPPPGAVDTVRKGDTLILRPRLSDTVNIFTRYTDFTGSFVMHCHILDHEDLGMMEVVQVVRQLPAMAMTEVRGMHAGMPAAPASPASPASPAKSGAKPPASADKPKPRTKH